MKRKVLVSLMVALLVVSFSIVGMAKEVDITIVHTNDTHSRVEEGKYAGMGFAKIATIVKQARSEVDNVLLLDAGDTFHGQTIANLVQGESIVKILNTLGYDALVPGNHDFNYGHQRLTELDEMTDFPIISANVTKKGDNTKFKFRPYTVKDIEGVKVVILGLSTPETTYKTHPKNVEGLSFRDPVKAAQDMVKMIKEKEKADVIIALTHLGLSEGSKYTSKKVAQEVPEIDLIVDGHSHHSLEDGVVVNGTPIVMAGEHDKAVGIVNLSIKDGQIVKGESELVTKEKAANIAKDKEVLKVVEEIKAKNDKITSVVVGKADVKLNGERAKVRTGETNLGNLITDAMLEAVDADLALTNGGGIRASIAPGKVTKGEVITVLPFGNYVVVKEIKGRTILEAIEHGISKYPAHEGLFPQVGGMAFLFDPSQSAGKRGLELMIDGKPINPDKNYKVATNDFMAAGGDGYSMLKGTKTVQEAGGLEEVVIDYIKKRGSVAPNNEGRIIPIVKKANHYEYTIQSGDTLSQLALWFRIDMSKLVEANNIKNPDLIYAGTNLKLAVE